MAVQFENANTPVLGTVTGNLFGEQPPVAVPPPAPTPQPNVGQPAVETAAAPPAVPPTPQPVDAGALLRQMQQGNVSPTTPEPVEPTPTKQTPPASPATTEPQNDGTQQGEGKEAMREALKALMREEFGIDPDQFKQQQETQRLSQDISTLESIWGVTRQEVGERLSVLSQSLSTMSPDLQKAFSTPQALSILWQAVQSQQAQTAPVWQGGQNTFSPTPATRLTQADIDSMSREEYARRQPEIIAYYQMKHNARG